MFGDESHGQEKKKTGHTYAYVLFLNRTLSIYDASLLGKYTKHSLIPPSTDIGIKAIIKYINSYCLHQYAIYPPNVTAIMNVYKN